MTHERPGRAYYSKDTRPMETAVGGYFDGCERGGTPVIRVLGASGYTGLAVIQACAKRGVEVRAHI